MAYQTLCHRFSVNSTKTAADMIGLASCVGMNAVMNAGLSSTLIVSVTLGMVTGSAGWIVGAIAENMTKKALSTRRIGMTRGSRIVQVAGVGGYGVVLGGMLSLNSMMIAPFMEAATPLPETQRPGMAIKVSNLPSPPVAAASSASVLPMPGSPNP
jgi:hypothetical protein